MSLLGAILAGGRSRRFGADKAAAIVDGRPLFEHAAAALHRQVDALIICGRAWPGYRSVPDRPAPGLGPLGGLCAALNEAARSGHEAVLTVGCDVLPVPPDLLDRLGDGPACIEGQPLFGLWPAALSTQLDHHLARTVNRSMRHWIEISGARTISFDERLFNINTRSDLAVYAARPQQRQ